MKNNYLQGIVKNDCGRFHEEGQRDIAAGHLKTKRSLTHIDYDVRIYKKAFRRLGKVK